MESNAALAASLGISLTLGVAGLTFVALGFAIRGAGRARIMSRGAYADSDDPERINRWIGLRLVALGAGALAAALVSFSWSALAVPILGVFGVAASIAVALIVAGPAARMRSAPLEAPRPPAPRERSTPGDWASDPERRRADLGQGGA